MGRTVPTWRGRVEQEIERLVPYRRALSLDDCCNFDVMLNDVRSRRAAGGMLPAQEEWKPMLLSMLVGAHQRIRVLEGRLESFERRLIDAGVLDEPLRRQGMDS
jgi:hypothetical protein